MPLLLSLLGLHSYWRAIGSYLQHMSAEQALEVPATHVRRKSLAELARITALPREEDELLQHAARLGKFLLVGILDHGGHMT